MQQFVGARRSHPEKVAATEEDIKRWMIHHRITVRRANMMEKLCIHEVGGLLAVNKFKYVAELADEDGNVTKSRIGPTPYEAIEAIGIPMWLKGGAINLS